MSNGKHADVSAVSSVGKRILIVDDNEDFAHTLAVILNQWGHQTSISYDGTTALTKAPAFAPDVIILDIRMPGLNGYETAEQLRQTVFGKIILIISVSGTDMQPARVLPSLGIDHHLMKPLDFNVLKHILDNMDSH